jgi:hypothetical protein
LIYGGYNLKIYHHEKENDNHDIAYRCVCCIKHKLRPAKAFETTTATRSTLMGITLIGE